MNLWWYSNGIQQTGPIAEDALIELIKKGQVRPSYLVWCNTLSDWVSVSEAEAFARFVPKRELLPPTPPKAVQPTLIAAPSAQPAEHDSAVIARVQALHRTRRVSQVTRQAQGPWVYLFRVAMVAVAISSALPWFEVRSSTTMDLSGVSSNFHMSTPDIRMPNGQAFPAQFQGDFSLHSNQPLRSSGAFSVVTQGYMIFWVDLATLIAVGGFALGLIRPASMFGSNCNMVMTIIAAGALGACVLGIVSFSSINLSGSFGNGFASSTVGTHLAIGGYVGTIAALLGTISAYLTPWTSIGR